MNLSDLTKRIQALETRSNDPNKLLACFPVGIVSVEGELVEVIDAYTGDASSDEPLTYIAEVFKPALLSRKRFIVLYGGRSSTKSTFAANLTLIKACKNLKTYCLREYQASISDSVIALIDQEIERLRLKHFEVLRNCVQRFGRDVFRFAGLARNVSSIKSAAGFSCYWCEESDAMSDESITKLLPTARNIPRLGLPLKGDKLKTFEDNNDGAQFIFTLNPQSEQDPFSQRFLKPFQDSLDASGFYEDDLHLIIKANYSDNPWHFETGLESDRQFDEKNMPRALYEHVWLAAYNDSVPNALIQPEWFEACIDAHIKLGKDISGARFAAHDPADVGRDAKGFAMRQGMVFTHLDEMTDGGINDGSRWATNRACELQCDYYSWDADGMGGGLIEQVDRDIKAAHSMMKAAQFHGSKAPDGADNRYKPCQGLEVAESLLVKDYFLNKRAQYYIRLRHLMFKTYQAIEHGESVEDGEWVSFDSSIKLLSKLKSELCRMPVTQIGGGKVKLLSKEEMKGPKYKLKSPNLADSVMMCLREKGTRDRRPTTRPPRPNRTFNSSRRLY